MSKRNVNLRVSYELAELMKSKHSQFNQNIARKYFGKDIDFTDFTCMLVPSVEQACDLVYGKSVLMPLKKNKKHVNFEVFPQFQKF